MAKHKLISYTLGEEIFSSVTHGLGALFGVFVTVFTVVRSALGGSALAVVCSAIYGASLIILFSMSTLYHAISHRGAKVVFRVLDHTTIFLLIAGTYTPYALVTLGGALGWTIFGVQWGVAILGITLNAVSIEKFKVFSMIGYVVCGWMIIIAALPMWRAMAHAGFWWLLGGGVLYTVGIIFYKLKKIRYMHAVWHIFVLLGAAAHFVSIAFYALPVVYK